MLPERFQTKPGFDPAEDNIGPFYYAKSAEGFEYAFEADQKHCNEHGIVHGGVLMAFADYCLCSQATDNYAQESCITVSFNSEFIAAAAIHSLVECTVEVIRKSGSMVFLVGKVRVAQEVVLTFSSVVKRIRLSS